MLERMNGFVAAQLGLSASQRIHVLDVGCGYGATIRQFLSEFPNASFAGISREHAQISIANEWHSGQNNSDKAEFQVADFTATPFPDSSFDAAFALESACFAEGDAKQNLVTEVARLLRPEGKLVVVDGFRKKNAPLPYPISLFYRKSTEAWDMDGLPVLELFTKTLENQGFVEIETKEISWNMAPSMLHVPWVCMKLMAVFIIKQAPDALHYAKALLLTLLLSPFKPYFGYFAVTCRKSSVRLGK